MRFFDERGPGFVTSRDSTKGVELAHEPRVAAGLVWPAMYRAIRFRGVVEEVDARGGPRVLGVAAVGLTDQRVGLAPVPAGDRSGAARGGLRPVCGAVPRPRFAGRRAGSRVLGRLSGAVPGGRVLGGAAEPAARPAGLQRLWRRRWRRRAGRRRLPRASMTRRPGRCCASSPEGRSGNRNSPWATGLDDLVGFGPERGTRRSRLHAGRGVRTHGLQRLLGIAIARPELTEGGQRNGCATAQSPHVSDRNALSDHLLSRVLGR